jgi:hypothetical protein
MTLCYPQHIPYQSKTCLINQKDHLTAPKPIRILRDTGASQSLLLEGVLPLSENTSDGATVLPQGVELGCFNVALCRRSIISESCICSFTRALPLEGASKEPECYYLKDDILMRKWRPPDALPSEEWRQAHQIVVPKVYRQEIIELAHDTPLAGHLGVRKTCQKVLQHFYWPIPQRNSFWKTC